MILLRSDRRIFHWAPILKAGILPDLHHRQMVWSDTPKNLLKARTFMILSSLSIISYISLCIAYHCLKLISSLRRVCCQISFLSVFHKFGCKLFIRTRRNTRLRLHSSKKFSLEFPEKLFKKHIWQQTQEML